ncbi:hypothetical protein, partial [Kamptonema formosum]|uniref:hypothetical protein n=1 Tax=Kamptonema formosum TaxID=331992 RepID=UPI001F30E201
MRTLRICCLHSTVRKGTGKFSRFWQQLGNDLRTFLCTIRISRSGWQDGTMGEMGRWGEGERGSGGAG